MKKANWDLWQKVGYWLVVAVLAVIAGITSISVLEIPKGIKVYTLQSGSMSPTLSAGSLIMIKPVDNYEQGDIITFKSQKDRLNQRPSKTTTHRIVEIRKTEQDVKYLTKGDANAISDADPVGRDLVLGKVIFSVPLLGFPVAFAKTLPGLIFLIVVPVTIIIYNEILNIKKEITDILKKGKKGKKKEKKRKDRENLLKLLILLLITCLPGAGKTNSYFIDQESITNNSFSTSWWADETPPESYITSLDPSYTALNFEIGYFADDPNTSGVKQVSLYYSHAFDEGEWRLFGTDVPDIDGNGFFEFTSPLGDGIYEFKTEAEDNAGNKEDKGSWIDALTQVDTQKPITMLSLGEFGPGRFATQEILANGNFEDTNNPFSGWVSGGDGDHKIVSDAGVVRDNNSFLIGFRDTNPSGLANLPAKDFLFQDISLPKAGSATLSFWYRLNTEDILNYDWFHALILDPLTNSRLAQIAHDGLNFFGEGITDLGWKEVTHSLADFLGQTIRLYFEVENTGDKNFQTWAYLDDIRITQGENFVDPATEISLEATDASGSGVLTTEYKVYDGDWEEYTDPFTLDEGEYELSYRSTDWNDLVEEEKTISLVVSPSADFLGVVINEFMPNPSGDDYAPAPGGEWVELWNNGSVAVDVNGWKLKDSLDNELVISATKTEGMGTTIVPGGTLRVYRRGSSESSGSSFVMDNTQDEVKLYTLSDVLVDLFSYPQVIENKSWKRIPDGIGTWADPGEEVEKEFLPEVEFGFREDKKAVWFKVSKIASFDLLKYEVVYDSSESERGIVGEIEINGQEEIERRDLILGTCSGIEGVVCVYDQGISKVQLKINLVSKDDEEEEIKKEIFP